MVIRHPVWRAIYTNSPFWALSSSHPPCGGWPVIDDTS